MFNQMNKCNIAAWSEPGLNLSIKGFSPHPTEYGQSPGATFQDVLPALNGQECRFKRGKAILGFRKIEKRVIIETQTCLATLHETMDRARSRFDHSKRWKTSVKKPSQWAVQEQGAYFQQGQQWSSLYWRSHRWTLDKRNYEKSLKKNLTTHIMIIWSLKMLHILAKQVSKQFRTVGICEEAQPMSRPRTRRLQPGVTRTYSLLRRYRWPLVQIEVKIWRCNTFVTHTTNCLPPNALTHCISIWHDD